MSELFNDVDKTVNKKTKQRGKRFTAGGQTFIQGQSRELRDGTKVKTTAGFGNFNTGAVTMYAIFPDGKKRPVSPGDFKPAKAGAPSNILKDESQTKSRAKPRSLELDRLYKSGIVTGIDTLKKQGLYQKSTPSDKQKLIKQLTKIVPDKEVMNKAKKEKIVAPSKYDKKGNLLKTAFTESINKLSKGLKSGSVKMGGGGGFPIQIQAPLLIDKDRLKDERSMSPRAFANKYGRNKYASGGMVNASNGAFVEVQNNFSDRMLPNKKRTTRIY